nr:MAG TPA: hypothetical protein [Caudoviricetes sp.]DAN47256.1 MAG TPA: hypothetical protein [Caudoviricetes sp.]DAX52597.1 MAG TPA: hypothetical protein [Caudoviricetes sp.]
MKIRENYAEATINDRVKNIMEVLKKWLTIKK